MIAAAMIAAMMTAMIWKASVRTTAKSSSTSRDGEDVTTNKKPRPIHVTLLDDRKRGLLMGTRVQGEHGSSGMRS